MRAGSVARKFSREARARVMYGLPGSVVRRTSDRAYLVECRASVQVADGALEQRVSFWVPKTQARYVPGQPVALTPWIIEEKERDLAQLLGVGMVALETAVASSG